MFFVELGIPNSTILEFSLAGVNMATQLENRMVCVERMTEYTQSIGREPEWELEACMSFICATVH